VVAVEAAVRVDVQLHAGADRFAHRPHPCDVLGDDCRERARLVATLLVVAALLAGGLALVRPALLDSVVTRALAITNSTDPNVQYRLIENRAASEQIADHPLIGNGLGKDYLFDFSRYGVKPITKSYIHNNYYWFTQRLGFIGLGLFLWTMAAFLLPWMRYRSLLDRRDPWMTGLIFGSRAMVVVLLAVSITSPRLNSRTSIVIASVVIGMAEVALSMARKREMEQSAPEPSSTRRSLHVARSR